ncbi:MAG: signal recognition particle-docking protein FtsY [Parachlamydiales bacterium]|jgi:fused signal recognition particle receptor
MIFNALKAGYARVASAFSRTGSLLGSTILSLFKGKVDEDTIDKLEQIFYEADLGASLASDLAEKVRLALKKQPDLSAEQILDLIRSDLSDELKSSQSELRFAAPGTGPTVIAIVGVNGNGKTTSIAKIAKKLKDEGKSVLIAAGDTFRAAAIDQLEIWAQRLDVPLVKGQPNSDPAAVVFDALTAAKSREIDIVLIDTAGRLQTKIPLMQELEKLRRICKKVCPDAPHETLLVIDANQGQNGVDQALSFHKFIPLTGLIVTKLDGKAKGGIVIQIQRTLGIPVKFIGVGESAEDLQPFNAEAYCQAMLQ